MLSEIFLGYHPEQKVDKTFFLTYFLIWCHLTEMNAIWIMVGCIWFDYSEFLRCWIFKFLSSWSLEPSYLSGQIDVHFFFHFAKSHLIEIGSDYMINDPMHYRFLVMLSWDMAFQYFHQKPSFSGWLEDWFLSGKNIQNLSKLHDIWERSLSI